MPLPLFKNAIDQCPDSIESVAFALIGEPLLHPDIHTMIAYARSKGLRTVLYTNGTLLSGNIRARIVESGLDVLVISAEPDSANSLKHRGVKLETIKAKINDFLKIKPDSMEVKLSVVVHQDNVDAIPDIENQYRGIIKHIKLSPMIRYNGTRSTSRCIEPWRGSLGILTNGDVTPCCVSAGYRPITVGNLKNHNLNDMMNGSAFKACLAELTKGNRPDVCHRCRAYQRKDIPLRVPALSGKPRVPH
jgi:radical SAM protein with 4Fe4S-binding SPASM domain